MAESDSVVFSYRGPKALSERLERVAAKRQVLKGVIQREALEVYLALGERGIRAVPYHPGGFDDSEGVQEASRPGKRRAGAED